MKKKYIKKIIIYFLLMILIASTVNAMSVGGLTGNTSASGNNEVRTIGNKFITIFSTVGTIISVIVIIILGIKYMLGSVEEKAEYKKSLMPYLIGAVCIFAASNIASIIYKFAININK